MVRKPHPSPETFKVNQVQLQEQNWLRMGDVATTTTGKIVGWGGRAMALGGGGQVFELAIEEVRVARLVVRRTRRAHVQEHFLGKVAIPEGRGGSIFF